MIGLLLWKHIKSGDIPIDVLKSMLLNGDFITLSKEGVAHPAQSEIVRQKMQDTTFERFGVKYASQSSDVKAKMAATTMERYGVEHYSSTDECKEKVRSTLEKRYNVSNAHFLYKKVELDGISFDSSWELAFYLYHRDNGFNIKRCEKSFEYVYKNETHKYFPDF